MGSKTILITLPSSIKKDKLPLPPRVPMFSRTIVDAIKVEVDDSSPFSPVGICKGRKRKLENLSNDEKILRKKMKNRVAAQNSRDKKKARMSELEKLLAQAHRQINQLRAENAALRMSTCTKCGQEVSSRGSQDFVPAASNPQIPLQKGREQRLETHWPAWCTAWALLLLVMACKQQLTQTRKIPDAVSLAKNVLNRSVVKDMRAERMKWWGSHQNTWNPLQIRM